ncbi:dephospho-CoA kinase [Candidatus Woesearchaeota archaeon]|jgi:dephospho-CoA kinase|nr:dephospho-CoA kinase [Candidatus Woesearchaeota archaeon]MBT6040717.1 dephospho-CoA kinase [Candidatus Woesearchaeota archaeon]MBT6336164.1 dephospho-CoA kinase [Candidatus Woesearchaeota archaeon]MBT7928136.1 dephospho-CoA kinase [Candidatus Woesearchaeota archaeon]
MKMAIQQDQSMIRNFVPLYVKQYMESQVLGQYVVGLTGGIACGKSYVGRKFVEIGNAKGINVHNIELDYVGHQILSELMEPLYVETRKQITETFGQEVRLEDGTIDRKELGAKVFGNNDEMDKLNEIMLNPLLIRTKQEMYGKKGLILINAALTAEFDMGYLSNNNVVMVYADKPTQTSRLASRGLTPEEMQRRLDSQLGFHNKMTKLEEAIERDKHGKIWVLDNSKSANEIEAVFDKVVSELKVK